MLGDRDRIYDGVVVNVYWIVFEFCWISIVFVIVNSEVVFCDVIKVDSKVVCCFDYFLVFVIGYLNLVIIDIFVSKLECFIVIVFKGYDLFLINRVD